MNADLIVIGGGLSGTMAALRAQSQGKRVILIQKAWGGSAMSCGGFGISNPDSPYLEPALGLFKSSVPIVLKGNSKEAVSYLLQTGRLKNCSWVMESHDYPFQFKGMVVGGFYPYLPLHHHSNVQTVSLTWHREEYNLMPSVMAKRLDDLDELHVFSEHLKKSLSSYKFSTLMLPPILGLERYGEARQELERQLGVEVFEMLGSYPSVPGVRFQKGLEKALHQKEIMVVQGNVKVIHTSQKRVTSLMLQDYSKNEITIEGNRFVLATGKFFSGGIRKRQRFYEPLLGCPLDQNQSLFEVGVQTDKDLYPVDPFGERLFENVRACGTVLQGVKTFGSAWFQKALETGVQAGDLEP